MCLIGAIICLVWNMYRIYQMKKLIREYEKKIQKLKNELNV